MTRANGISSCAKASTEKKRKESKGSRNDGTWKVALAVVGLAASQPWSCATAEGVRSYARPYDESQRLERTMRDEILRETGKELGLDAPKRAPRLRSFASETMTKQEKVAPILPTNKEDIVQEAVPAIVSKVTTESASDETVENNGLMAVANSIGIVGAGIAFGLYMLQRAEKEDAVRVLEEEKSLVLQAVEAERKSGKLLQDALAKEKELARRLQDDSLAAARAAQRSIQVEKENAEATRREKEATERALAAEQALAAALAKERDANQKALEAEKIARYAAEAEAKERDREIDGFVETLERERELMRKVGTEALEAKAEASAQKLAAAEAKVQVTKSEMEVDNLSNEVNKARETNKHLESELGRAQSQASLLVKVGKRTIEVQEAMAEMRKRAGEQALRASRIAREAQEQREHADKELQAATQALEAERSLIAKLSEEVENSHKKIEEQRLSAEKLQKELEATKTKAKEEQIAAELAIASANKKLAEMEARYSAESSKSSGLESDIAQMKAHMESLKEQLHGANDALEAEQDRTRQAMEDLQKSLLEEKRAAQSAKALAQKAQEEVANLRRELATVTAEVSKLQRAKALQDAELQQERQGRLAAEEAQEKADVALAKMMRAATEATKRASAVAERANLVEKDVKKYLDAMEAKAKLENDAVPEPVKPKAPTRS